MTYPRYNNEPMGQIYVDQKTKDDCAHKIRFNYKTHASFKGKAYKQPIYSPVDPDEDYAKLHCIPIERLLLIHSNPFIIDRDSNFQYNVTIQLGKNKLRESALEEFKNMIIGISNSFVAIIEGTAGCGKSLFAREFAREILVSDARGLYSKWAKGKKIKIFASHLNPVSEKRCFNNWRIILPSMLSFLSKECNTTPAEIIDKLIKEADSKVKDKIFLIEQLFGIKMTHGYYDPKLQYQPPYDPIAFVKKQEYIDDVIDPIITFIVDFVKFYIGEDESMSSKSNSLNSEEAKKNGGIPEMPPPLVIFLDDAQRMDKESWKLVDELQDSVTNLVIYIIMRTDTEGELQFSTKEIKEYFKLMESSDIIGARYTMSGLSGPHINELIGILGGVYRQEIDAEIASMIQEEDEKKREQMKTELRESFFTEQPMREIEHATLQSILAKTEGNPLLTFQFILNLIKARYLENKGGMLCAAPNFIKSHHIDDWISVEAPDLAIRINSMEIDKMLKATSEYFLYIPTTKNRKVIVTLKAASVLGQIFTLRQLKFITPLRSEGMLDLLKRMQMLEQANIIEIIDDNGVSDMTCRFLVPFYRETLYQKLLFREHKKGLHAMSAEYILNNAVKIDVFFLYYI